MGDAIEMMVAAELTLAGVPATTMPKNWPHYDLIAELKDEEHPQRISVKSRTFVRGSQSHVKYEADAKFDWLAIVLLPGDDQQERQIFIVPRDVADKLARRDGAKAKTRELYWQPDEIAQKFPEYKDNFRLLMIGTPTACDHKI